MRTILFFILFLNVFLFPEQKILPSDGNEEDSFGQSISVNDNWIAISANKSEYNGINSGSVYLYQHLNETFINEQIVMYVRENYPQYKIDDQIVEFKFIDVTFGRYKLIIDDFNHINN